MNQSVMLTIAGWFFIVISAILFSEISKLRYVVRFAILRYYTHVCTREGVCDEQNFKVAI